jgi:cytoskeletal protein RodZ
MSEQAVDEQAVEERRSWASDIVWVVLYSIVILLAMLLWVHVPA